ncbi:DUF5710 domain-containing protein [Noviherbaspirillum aerium]|uniref:DUF5710 domain-containing protein n=1 Tax=Noviherbaspirillum aerium TaxID=2588497 RepID=UPI00124C4F2E|nr:DUF5710 domain-containing protein [Noviherbaspirillum aerium]
MSITAPPFDPPYVSMHASEELTEYIETLADGSTRNVPEAAYGPALLSVREVVAGSKPASSSSSSSKSYLSVPYAEKDEAKALGARWDAARKKWYAPQGAELDRFDKWLPKT